MILDVRTIGIFSAFTPLVLAIIMLIYWKERKVYAGFGRWILAIFGLSVGYTLISLPSNYSAILSIVVGNSLIVYCMILIYEGIEKFYGRPSFYAFNYLLLVIHILLVFLFTSLLPNVNARLAVSSAAVLILIILAGSRLFRAAIPGLRRTSRAAGYVFLSRHSFHLYG